jgi:tripartite-type tricarboxylate transporter receptor subunit TctC
LALAAVSIGVTENSSAQSYPSRPITMIMSFAAGGPSDVIARIIVFKTI